MDWVRLGNSGVDLSGTNGIIAPVSRAELGQHNRIDDAWLAIRGKVYNVTKYMDFHPGGIDELMRGIGIDATKLFDEVHAWVNYEQLLAKCYIGPLRTNLTLNISNIIKKERSLSVQRDNNNDLFPTPFLPFMSLDKTPSTIPITPEVPQSTEIIPRFDWIQKTGQLTLVFYTKFACNPGIFVHCDSIKSTKLDIKIQIDQNEHLFKFKLMHNVEWPPVQLIVNNETGKIEIILNKSNPALWTNFGLLNRQNNNEIIHCDSYEYGISEIEKITHNSYALVLQPKEYIVQVFPIGYHFSATITVEGKNCFFLIDLTLPGDDP